MLIAQMHTNDLEDRIRAIGTEIFSRAHEPSLTAAPLRAIDNRLMAWTMRDPALKSQLFRFVDVLPSLRSTDQIAQHIREYLPIKFNGFSQLLTTAANLGIRRMARRFIAASNIDEAVTAVEQLRRYRLAFTIDLLGEAVVSEAEADEYQRKYLALIETLPARIADFQDDPLIDRDANGPIPRANISLKLSSLYSQFDPLDPEGTTRAVTARLRPLLRMARKNGAFINFDMEQSAYKEITLHIFKTIFVEDEFLDWPGVGIAIQAYLRHTLADLEDLAEFARERGTPFTIRLVKGAYWDYETVIATQNNWPVPVFTDKHETDTNFESASAFLIDHRDLLHPAIASHNVRSIAAAIAHAEAVGANPADIEFQMLFGMANPLKHALVSMNRRVRIYAPVGELLPGMAYLVRRLLENTSNESFLRAAVLDRVPQEQLLMNPKTLIKSSNSSSPRPILGERAEVRGDLPSASHLAGASSFDNEPLADFSLKSARDEMSWTIADFARRSVANEPLVIAGQNTVTGKWIESINPSHKSQVVARCAAASSDHANQAVAAAKKAFTGWRDVPPSERADLLDRLATILRRDRFALAAIEIAECGKPWREADADIAEAIDFCRYYAWQMRELSAPLGNNVPGERNDWTYESRGPAVIIAPWNFPLAILAGMATAAVVAGNPIILKPAEQSPLIASRLAAAFTEAGAPPGVVNYLPGVGEEIGPALVSHPDVALIAFTGSRAVGLGINHLAAAPLAGQDHVKRVIVEMGGKNALIIDEDADLDDAVAATVSSAFVYSGQKCSACSRVIVLPQIYDAFLARLTEAAASLKIAPAEDPACRVGPVIDAEAHVRILGAIERGKHDARLAFAGDVGSLADEGYYIAAHIFAEVPRASALATEEIFGPVLSVMKAANLDEALAIANSVKYALTGGIFSRSPVNIARARREFRVGNLYINRKVTGALVGRQPFGGFKLSGAGTQAGGPDYLRHFLLPRCITENTLRHGFTPDV
jgi:RHH-type proline utilization regulon transcriptional repressor/proline dehydrogenase/delta 1-pyrroline-5-carboxylate dehydrogenase